MTRPSQVTRERIMKAAERLFAERGYDGTSIRAIVARARVNQAAINYHFAGKDGLYREVLRAAFRGLTEHQLAHAGEASAMSREEALAAFIRRQLRPLLARDEASRHIRIFNWESVRPTPVFRKLLSEETSPFMGLTTDLVRRFLPEADPRTLVVAAIWLSRPVQHFRAQPRAARRAAGGAGAREILGRMAGADDQPLDDRRSRPVRLTAQRAEKPADCRKNSLFSAIGCQERMFEIQSSV